jgi:hypothetical protein
LKDIGVDGRILVAWILSIGMERIGLIWLRIGKSGKML